MSYRFGYATRTSDGSLLGGDIVAVDQSDDSLGVIVMDVAGSGWSAAPTAWRARQYAEVAVRLDPKDALCELHQKLTGARGAVAAAARFDCDGVCMAGVGDVRMQQCRAGSSSTLPILSGQLGGVFPNVTEQRFPIRAGDVFTIVTDGIQTRADVASLATGFYNDPTDVAERILARWHRPHDDATCVVVMAG